MQRAETAVTIAHGVGRAAITELATVIAATPGSGEVSVVVLNQLGFARSGTVAITALRGTTVRSVRDPGGTRAPVQALGDDRWLFQAEAPSFGYTTYCLSDQPVDSSPAVSSTVDGNTITLASAALRAVVSSSAGFGITSLVPIVGGVDQPDLIPEGGLCSTFCRASS